MKTRTPLRDNSPVRIALLGHGTVGGGVFQRLARHPRFTFVGCAVRDQSDHHRAVVPRRLLSDDPYEVLNRDSDLVVELIGGLEPARSLVRAALERGRHVVTANKRLIADSGAELVALARHNGVRLAYSAAVGGGVPVLETLDEIRANQQIRSIRGVLSGTANFVLSALAQGTDFETAIAQAQAAGLAEADPARDIDGTDVAEKLSIVIERAFGKRIDPSDVPREGIEGVSVGLPLTTLVASATQVSGTEGDVIVCAVRPEILSPDDSLAGLVGAENRIVVTTEDGAQTVRSGLGAGRWPTSASVCSDIDAVCQIGESR